MQRSVGEESESGENGEENTSDSNPNGVTLFGGGGLGEFF